MADTSGRDFLPSHGVETQVLPDEFQHPKGKSSRFRAVVAGTKNAVICVGPSSHRFVLYFHSEEHTGEELGFGGYHDISGASDNRAWVFTV